MRLTPRRLSFFGLGAVALAAAGAVPLARPFSDDVRATDGAATWKEVERLVSEQKFEEASRRVAKIRETARAAGDEADEAKALVREVQLRTALHGYETSVRFLKDQPWPKALLPRTALRLFYAQSLVTYARAYAWEIGQRERVASTGAVDLKAWTREEIAAEAVRTYAEVFRDRESLGNAKVAALDEYLVANSYAKGIRDTLRAPPAAGDVSRGEQLSEGDSRHAAGRHGVPVRRAPLRLDLLAGRAVERRFRARPRVARRGRS